MPVMFYSLWFKRIVFIQHRDQEETYDQPVPLFQRKADFDLSRHI